jgi:hypothetical protein
MILSLKESIAFSRGRYWTVGAALETGDAASDWPQQCNAETVALKRH